MFFNLYYKYYLVSFFTAFCIFITFFFSDNLLLLLLYFISSSNINIYIYILFICLIYNKSNILNILIIPISFIDYLVITGDIRLINGLFFFHPCILFIFYNFTLISSFLFLRQKLFFLFFKKNNFYYNIFYFVIVLVISGMFWSQQELNWGGWWSWDFIEIINLGFFYITIYYIHINRSKDFFFLIVFIILNFFFIRYSLIMSVHTFTVELSTINLLPVRYTAVLLIVFMLHYIQFFTYTHSLRGKLYIFYFLLFIFYIIILKNIISYIYLFFPIIILGILFIARRFLYFYLIKYFRLVLRVHIFFLNFLVISLLLTSVKLHLSSYIINEYNFSIINNFNINKYINLNFFLHSSINDSFLEKSITSIRDIYKVNILGCMVVWVKCTSIYLIFANNLVLIIILLILFILIFFKKKMV